MNNQDDDFKKKLLLMFKEEAKEHIEEIISGLLELEKRPEKKQQQKLIDTVFRAAHSLKGAARAADQISIETICQSLENVFSILKKKELNTTPHVFETLYGVIDSIKRLIPDKQETLVSFDVSSTIDTLNSLNLAEGRKTIKKKEKAVQAGKSGLEKQKAPQPALNTDLQTKTLETVRVSTEKLETLLLEIGELVSIKQSINQRSRDLTEANKLIQHWNKELYKIYQIALGLQKRQSTSISTGKQGKANMQLGAIVDFLFWSQTYFKSFDGKLTDIIHSTKNDHRVVEGMFDSLQDEMKQVLMLPVSLFLKTFSRFV
ncbi:MAG: Hpt domain-containing protein, partial [Crocinitomicaceae bacterium]|nr:Hpt domain-containing protein [Crocinitomicaceae bacterium]